MSNHPLLKLKWVGPPGPDLNLRASRYRILLAGTGPVISIIPGTRGGRDRILRSFEAYYYGIFVRILDGRSRLLMILPLFGWYKKNAA